jgi:hypothetical protein
MKVYHGSYAEIEKINLSLCEIKRDFGQGFYVTNLHEQAEVWAQRKGRPGNGFVTEFEFNENICRIMKLKRLSFEDYNSEWLDFVVLNRRNDSDIQAHDYDIVEGPVADDRITTRVDDFINGIISREQFLSELIYNSPSHQICFCTVQSLQALSLSKHAVDSVMFHVDDEIMQALMSDYGMTELEATDTYYTSDTYSRFANENTKLYLKPWQEIYEMLKGELKI